jgi:hypothetical protein
MEARYVKTALLYNYKAGKGLPAELVVRKLCDFFSGDELLVTDEGLLFPALPVSYVVPEETQGYFDAIKARVKALADAGAERFVSVGGDGTATYVKNAMYELGINFPILGVAAGTANVGPIVSVTLEQLEGRHISEAKEVCYDGIAVYVKDKFISLAFNDLIVGDTFLGTIDGQTCSLSVRALLERGEHTPVKPAEHIVTDDFVIELNGKELVPNREIIRQIVLSPVAHESHYGRAVYGPVGKCDWCEKKGVIALCDYIAVSFEEDGTGVDRISSTQYLIFGPNDQVALRGLTEEACLVCDGNPYLLPDDRFSVRYEPASARTIKL